MLKFVWSYIKRYQANLLQIAICSVLIAGVDLTEPYLTAKFIDEILVVQDRAYFYTFIAFLVVCDLSVTMLIFLFRIAFNKVDLPTFGRPKIETKPDFIILNPQEKRQTEEVP